jgi:hypothetical protein
MRFKEIIICENKCYAVKAKFLETEGLKIFVFFDNGSNQSGSKRSKTSKNCSMSKIFAEMESKKLKPKSV